MTELAKQMGKWIGDLQKKSQNGVISNKDIIAIISDNCQNYMKNYIKSI